jgi:hypothetical protein
MNGYEMTRQEGSPTTGRNGFARNEDHARRMTEIALRGTALLWGIHMRAAHSVLEAQASTAAWLGAPDVSDFVHAADARARRMFGASFEQALHSIRQINDTLFEMQRQFTRVAEQQTLGIAERLQHDLERLNEESVQGLDELRRLAGEEADEVERAVREARSRNGNGEARDGKAAPSNGEESQDASRRGNAEEGQASSRASRAAAANQAEGEGQENARTNHRRDERHPPRRHAA